MRYSCENIEKLTQHFGELKEKVQKTGKLHFSSGYSDSAHLWTIIYNYLVEIVNSAHKKYISEPIFEISVYPSKKQYIVKANKTYCTCFKGYIAKKTDYEKIITDISDMLLKYGLKLYETEESVKQHQKKYVIEHSRQYVVKFLEK